jgi:hypothetical protein
VIVLQTCVLPDETTDLLVSQGFSPPGGGVKTCRGYFPGRAT